MKDILKVHATRTDSAGNGYYRASDGYYYYGNAQNGYLVETEETKRLKAQKAAWDAPHNQSSRNYSSQSTGSCNSLGDLLAIKAGTIVGELLVKVLFTVVPFLTKVLCVLMILPAMVLDYMNEFIAYNSHIGDMLLSLIGLLAVFALIGYGIYRRIKGQNSITKQVFIGEMVALTGIYYLNWKTEDLAIFTSVFMALFFAYSVKVLSSWSENIVYNIYKRVHTKK